MLRSLYSGVSGMRGFQTKLDVIGNNIANVNTVGFKAGRVMFKDILSQTVAGATPSADGATGGVNAKQVGLGVALSAIDTLHTPGSAMTTNYPTDLRIDGDGFFAVKATEEQEEPFLTRAGNFSFDANNQLVTADGMFVVDSAGDIIDLDDLGTVTAYSISNSGEIITTDDTGATNNSGVFIGVVKVPNPAGLEKIGGNLYRGTGNSNSEQAVADLLGVANDAETGTGAIVTGQVEMSNVDLTAEFTEMIVAQRGFQANSRIITTSDQILQEVVNLKN
ncbi:flagellar hook-basal body complex protein [Paenibacillus xerothermodurans]|uniref:Flagellar hook protein FlgE n=1 Tax=Paenibacillus xerothermodurans TaxID=1977292 RepID=A0A2W1P5R3_PAEXE|nr:flagellar hook-basal body complex protein [Paenibacillus xerothermodurans]PZE22448.1 flagellar hook-basal body complex protein [Paenibacillus xerothermodurans]